MDTIVCTDPEGEPSATEVLELDLDIRIFELLIEAWTENEWDEAHIARYLRLSYAAGYLDALRERERGELCQRHGLPVPTRGGRGGSNQT